MNNFDKCPVCQSAMLDRQPESINGRQDVIYICGCSVTYELDSPEDFERTIECKNKIDWEHIYVEYGGEFDESAKLIDKRFYGWIELQFYREAHFVNNWNNLTNFMDKQYLDEYFENKESYINKLREQSTNVIPKEIDIIRHTLYSNPPEKLVTIVKNYHQEPFVGEFVVKEKNKFNRDEYDVTLFEIIRSKDKPELMGSYILEEICDNFKKNRITLYEKDIVDIILKDYFKK